MSIEVKFNSVILRTEDIEEHFPALVPTIKSYMQSKKRPRKRRARKKKKTAAVLIDKIIDDIEAG